MQRQKVLRLENVQVKPTLSHNTWEEIYGPESWAANPWVWVVEFKRIDADIARKEQRKSRMVKIAEKKRATSTKQS